MTKREFQQQEYIREAANNLPGLGASFYCIDGMKKGDFIVSDFRPTTTSLHEVYYKYTFALKTNQGILYTDIASINKDLKVLMHSEEMPMYLRPHVEITINPILADGTIQ